MVRNTTCIVPKDWIDTAINYSITTEPLHNLGFFIQVQNVLASKRRSFYGFTDQSRDVIYGQDGRRHGAVQILIVFAAIKLVSALRRRSVRPLAGGTGEIAAGRRSPAGALTLALLLPSLSVSGQATVGQAAPLMLPDMPLHDPWIVTDAATRTYWLFTRNEKTMTHDRRVGVMAYTSRDLKNWTRPTIIFRLPHGMWANDGAWAPEVHRWRGGWYTFTTVHNEGARLPSVMPRRNYRRGTIVGVADRLGGPFRLINRGEPVAPAGLMTLDGTLYVDREGKPWSVYAHEWLQTGIGTIAALPLNASLRAIGPPRTLFKASDAPWAAGYKQPEGDTTNVTDGPELFRTRTGRLLMLWSSYDAKGGYVQGLARSTSGELFGPWEQLPPLVRGDSGHGMLFRRFDGTLMMVLHRPFRNARGKLYEMRDTGDTVEVVREATELDGETRPVGGAEPPGK